MNILSNILKLELYDLINKYTIKIYQYDYYNNILNKLVDDKQLFIEYITKINISERCLKSIGDFF